MSAVQIENLTQALDLVAERARAFAELYAPLEKALLERQTAARRVAQLFANRERAVRELAQAYESAKDRASSLKEDALNAASSAPALVGDLAEILKQLAECAESHEREYDEQAMACMEEARDLKEEKEQAERHAAGPF